MGTAIGGHKLANVPSSFFNPDGNFIKGGIDKSSAVDKVLLKFHIIFLWPFFIWLF